MKKELSYINTKGFAVVEALLAATIFGLMVTAVVGVFLYGEESTALSGSRARAVMLAEEGIEALHNIRDNNFANLVAGTHGFVLTNNTWTLSGTQDTEDVFTRSVVLTSVDDTRVDATVTVSWQQNSVRAGSVSISTRLTNWQAEAADATCSNQADYLAVDVSTVAWAVANRELQNVLVSNTNTDCNIIIASITLSWSYATDSKQIRFDNSLVWNDTGSSGDVLDIDDVTIANADGNLNTKYRFSGTMTGDSVSIIFTMGDGTTKTESSITP